MSLLTIFLMCALVLVCIDALTNAFFGIATLGLGLAAWLFFAM